MNRYKIISGLMVFVALFLVIVAFNYLKVDFGPGPIQQKSNISFALDNDWDNDGLTNREESYWNTDPLNPDTDGDGYLDGEEVASGHDPLIPGPDDKLLVHNLTKKIANLALGGITDNSLKPANPNYNDSLSMIVDEILYQSQTNSPLKIISPHAVESTPENILNYAVALLIYLESIINEDFDGFVNWVDIMGEVDLSNISTLTQNPELYKKSTAEAERQAHIIKKQLQALQAFNVPKKFLPDHIELLVFFEKIKRNYELFAQTSNDPVQSLITFQELTVLFTGRSFELFGALSEKLGNNLNP